MSSISRDCNVQGITSILIGERNSDGYICITCFKQLETYDKKQHALMEKAKVTVTKIDFSPIHENDVIEEDITSSTKCYKPWSDVLPRSRASSPKMLVSTCI